MPVKLWGMFARRGYGRLVAGLALILGGLGEEVERTEIT